MLIILMTIYYFVDVTRNGEATALTMEDTDGRGVNYQKQIVLVQNYSNE